MSKVSSIRPSIHRTAILSALGTAAWLLFMGTSAPASVVFYSDPGAFQAAAPAAANYGFPYPDTNDFVDRPFIDGPLGFSTFDHFTHLFLENDWVYGPELPYLSTVNPFGGSVTSAIEPQVEGITALGFDLGTRNGADIVSVSINFQPSVPVTTFTTPGGGPNTVFFGITSTDPITQINFTTATGSEIDLLDFYAGAAAVPEPSTWALLGLGVAGLAGQALRRRLAA